MVKSSTRPDSKVPKPPRTLGQPGANLWSRIAEEYDISDSGGQMLLALACAALDRAESLRVQIDREGEIVEVKGSQRDNPLLRHELANRSFVAKTLTRMGLNLEAPARGIGRPVQGGLGITAEYLRRNGREDA
jgi:hypothetical protein